jgi:hypothetical protein
MIGRIMLPERCANVVSRRNRRQVAASQSTIRFMSFTGRTWGMVAAMSDDATASVGIPENYDAVSGHLQRFR